MAAFTVALMAMCAMSFVLLESEESDATMGVYTGSSADIENRDQNSATNPYTGINCYAVDVGDGEIYYVLNGSTISIVHAYTFPLDFNVMSVTSGFGLSASGGSLNGTLSKSGSITVNIEAWNGDTGEVDFEEVFTIVSVDETEPVTSISISGNSTVTVGSTLTLTATTSPSTADDRHVTWSITSGSSRVTYTTSDTTTGGRIVLTGVSAGSVTVRATASDGSGVYSEHTIRISEPSILVTGVTINGENAGTVGSTITLTATTSPSNADIRSVEWTITSGSTRASVSSTTNTSSGGSAIIVLSTAGSVTIRATASDGSGEYAEHTITISEQMNLYRLIFNANNGSGAPGEMNKTTSDSEWGFEIPATTPTRSGYTFVGWSTSPTATSKLFDPGDTVTATASEPTIRLYAVWSQDQTPTEYTSKLTYSNINGAINWPTDQEYIGTTTLDHDFTISTLTPVRSGYDFIGWATSAGATNATYQPGEAISVGYNSTQTLYAVWEAEIQQSEYTHTLAYNANGGTNAPASVTETNTSPSYSIPVSSVEPSRSGYNFLGWARTASTSTATIWGGDMIEIGANITITLYAVWELSEPAQVNHTVSFNLNGGTGTIQSQSIVDGGTVAEPVNPTRTGFIFTGWQYNGVLWNFTNPVTSDMTLVAVWNPVGSSTTYFVVTFDGNGGTVGYTQQNVISGNAVVLPSASRDGHTFDGWYSGSTRIGNIGDSYLVVSNITLTAQWTEIVEEDDNDRDLWMSMMMIGIILLFIGMIAFWTTGIIYVAALPIIALIVTVTAGIMMV